MIGFVLAAVATGWCAVVFDIVVESTVDSTTGIQLFGRSLVATTATAETLVLIGLAMTAAAVITASIQSYRRRAEEMALHADVDKRWEEISIRKAGMEARNELLEWRLQDLREQVDGLLARRDELLAAERDLDEARDAVRSTRSRGMMRQLREGVIVLPDIDRKMQTEARIESGDEETPAPAPAPPPGKPAPRDDNVTQFPA